MIYPENSVILAPLSGFTDLPYRRSAYRHGAVYAFTEMVDAGSLVYRNIRTAKMLERGEDESWLGLQFVASDKDILKKAAEIVNERNFDVIDFNLGCPAPKVVKKGEGAALGEKIDEVKAVVLINPNNPTGIVHRKEFVKMMVDLTEDQKIPLIVDEIYDLLWFDKKPVNAALERVKLLP